MDGCKKLKKRIKYIKELRKSTTLEIKNITNELIKTKNKRINRKKNADKEHYEYEKNKFYGLKYIRNLFDDDTDDDIYEGIECNIISNKIDKLEPPKESKKKKNTNSIKYKKLLIN